MFWRKKATIDADEEHWQLETWAWLLRHFGGVEGLWHWRQLYPRHEDFPRTGLEGHEHAEAVFAQVAAAVEVSTSTFRLEPQECSVDPRLGPQAIVQGAPASPLGTYSHDGRDNIVTYDPAQLGDLQGLIATFIHELCHPLLLAVPFPPPGDAELEEHATDLATVFFGFGVFGGNQAFGFQQHRDDASGTQGWSFRSAGYMTQNEWGYGLALRAALSGEPIEPIRHHASPELWTHVSRNARYLQANPNVVSELLDPDRPR